MDGSNTLRSGGYYTVLINTGNSYQLPYRVFATSDYHAARIVREETGYLANWYDIESG